MKSKKRFILNALIIFIFIFLIGLLSYEGYIYHGIQNTKTTVNRTNTTSITPRPSPLAALITIPSPTPSPIITPVPSNDVISESLLNLQFKYIPQTTDNGKLINIGEKSSTDSEKIILYEYSNPTRYDSVELFPKDPNLSLEQAITNLYGKGYDMVNDCQIITDKAENGVTYSPWMHLASIHYNPNNLDANDNPIDPTKCPFENMDTNGSTFFLMNALNPQHFAVIKNSIKLNGIDLSNNINDWTTSIYL